MKTSIRSQVTRASLATTASRNASWPACLIAGAAALFLPSADAADIQWAGTTGSYNSPADWTGGVIPAFPDNAMASNGGTVLIGPGDPRWYMNDLRGGQGDNTTGSFQQSGSATYLNGWLRMGVSPGSTGTMNLSGGILNVRNGRLNIGEAGTGILNITGGTLIHAGSTFIVGDRSANTTSLGTVNQSGGTFVNNSELWLGYGGNGTDEIGTFNLSGGTFTMRSWLIVGRTGAEGSLTLSGANTLASKSNEDGHFVVANPDSGTGSTGIFNHNSGTFNIGSEARIGNGATSNGTYNLADGAVNVNNWWALGRDSGTGTMNMTGGTLTKTGTGTNFTMGGLGTGANGTANQSGGLVNVIDGDLYIGETAGNSGTYTLSGTGELRVANIIVARTGSAQGTFQLDGGTLKAGRISKLTTDVASSGSVHFNGTQIIATGNNTDYIAALTNADIQAGGLKLNTDGYDVGTVQPFTGVGGLAKSGLGTLSIAGDFGATGASTVSGGALIANAGTFSGSSLTLSDGAGLGGDGTIAANTVVAASGATLLPNTIASSPLNFSGNLNLSGPTRIDFTDPVVTPGFYTAATYSGTLTGGANLSLGRPGSVSLTTPGQINVIVGAARTLAWTGAANSTWDIFSTANWDNSGSGAAFGQGDSVTLGDPAGTAPINVLGALRPEVLTFNNSSGNTITLQPGNAAAAVTGLVSVVKQGAGKAILGIDANLDGGSTVNIQAGELQVGNGASTGSLGQATIANAGTLHVNLSRDRIFSNPISGTGTGSLIKSGTGTLTLNASFANPGTTTINAGRLVLKSPAVPTGTGIVDNGELEVSNTANLTYTGTLSGSGKLIKSGTSELALAADNSGFTGDIIVNRGPNNSLNITNGNALGTTAGKTIVNGLNGITGQHLNIRALTAGGPTTIAEPIELRANAFGRAGITHEGGTQTLTLTGPITVSSPGISAVNIRNLNAGSTLNITGEISGSMGGANLFVRGSSGPINITGGINIQDDAELYFTEGVRIRLGAAGKTYTGFRTTIANNSQVRTLVNNALPVNQQVTIGEASNNNVSKLILGEGSTPVQQTIAGLVVNNTFAGSCIVGGATTNSTLTLDLRGNVNYTLPFGGAAANENNLNIVKTGIGTLTLSSGTTHVGTTTVSGGTLLVNGTSTSSAFIVQSGGTLGGIGTTGSITASGPAGRIAPGNAAIGTLTAFGSVQLGNDSGIDWQVGNWTGTAGSGFDLLNAGSLSITATAVNPVVIRVSEATLSNFTEANKSFTLVQTSAGVTGFAANKFVFDKTGFTGTGSFAARQDGNNLVIDYSVAPAGGNFASWAADNGVTGGADGDSDKDGIKNLIEYALNLNPAASDGAAGSFTGGTLSFSKRALAVSNGDVSYAIQTSTTLDSWSPATPTTNTDSEITLLLPKVQPKLFARLVVTQNP